VARCVRACTAQPRRLNRTGAQELEAAAARARAAKDRKAAQAAAEAQAHRDKARQEERDRAKQVWQVFAWLAGWLAASTHPVNFAVRLGVEVSRDLEPMETWGDLSQSVEHAGDPVIFTRIRS
jgi:multidrug efflux pump subunit AcrA (membrane-fusion protein)